MSPQTSADPFFPTVSKNYSRSILDLQLYGPPTSTVLYSYLMTLVFCTYYNPDGIANSEQKSSLNFAFAVCSAASAKLLLIYILMIMIRARVKICRHVYIAVPPDYQTELRLSILERDILISQGHYKVFILNIVSTYGLHHIFLCILQRC